MSRKVEVAVTGRKPKSHPLLGKVAKIKMDGNALHGCGCRICEVIEDGEGTIFRVQTTDCVGASPAGIVYDLHRYELELG